MGNVEARDIPAGAADVCVCDGFTGNVVLKLTEGLAQSLMGTATFGDQGRSFRAIDPGGLDMAWAAGELELVAVKGRLAAHITYIGDGFWDPAAICGALEEKWAG